MDWFLNYSIISIELIAFIIWIINYKKLNYNQSYLYFIAFSCLLTTEILAWILSDFFEFRSFLIHFIGLFIPYTFLSLIFFFKQIKTPLLKVTSKIMLVLLILFYMRIILYALFCHFEEIDTYISSLKNIIYFANLVFFLFFILIFYYETFNSNIILRLKYYFPFWISVSILTIHIGLLPIMIAFDIIPIKLYSTILVIINLLGYSLLIFGMIISKKIKNKKDFSSF